MFFVTTLQLNNFADAIIGSPAPVHTRRPSSTELDKRSLLSPLQGRPSQPHNDKTVPRSTSLPSPTTRTASLSSASELASAANSHQHFSTQPSTPTSHQLLSTQPSTPTSSRPRTAGPSTGHHSPEARRASLTAVPVPLASLPQIAPYHPVSDKSSSVAETARCGSFFPFFFLSS